MSSRVGIALASVFACSCGRLGFAPEPTQPGDGAGTDGANVLIDGAIAPANACGTNVVLSDAFSTTTTSAQWKVNQTADATVTQGGGALTIAFASPVQQNVMAGYQLASTTSFANSCVTVDLLNPPSASGSVVFGIGSVNVNVRLQVSGGSIVSLCEQGSNNVHHLDTRPYDSVTYRYLRLRSGNGWFWEASPDNATFSTFAADPCSNVPQTNVITLFAYASAGDTNDGSCKYGTVTVVN